MINEKRQVTILTKYLMVRRWRMVMKPISFACSSPKMPQLGNLRELLRHPIFEAHKTIIIITFRGFFK